MTKKSILMVLMGMALLGAPISANAQAAKVGAKIISKIASKTGTKASTKVGTTAGAAANDARAASRVKTSKYASKAEKTKTTRILSYECGNCNGRGTISTWSSYYGCYQSTTCSKCFGRGKVTRIVRY